MQRKLSSSVILYPLTLSNIMLEVTRAQLSPGKADRTNLYQ